MSKCWEDQAADRPTFSDTVAFLSQYLEECSGYTQLFSKKQQNQCDGYEIQHLFFLSIPVNFLSSCIDVQCSDLKANIMIQFRATYAFLRLLCLHSFTKNFM